MRWQALGKLADRASLLTPDRVKTTMPFIAPQLQARLQELFGEV